MSTTFDQDVARGERFEFGKNWSHFLKVLDERRIAEAVKSLQTMLRLPRLDGKRFLDAGSGSGIFSLAARRLGARVHSFDYDPASVACGAELRRRYFPDDPNWTVEQGSVLDPEYLSSLGTFDVVYSWGVLHHTGAMWQALANVVELVQQDGLLFISIYNDQGRQSRVWRLHKRNYNRLQPPLRTLYGGIVMGARELRFALMTLLRGKPGVYVDTWRNYASSRGMSKWHDLVDWIGGFPFEVARPEQIFEFYASRGFSLRKLRTVGGGLGCNEFVFQRTGSPIGEPFFAVGEEGTEGPLAETAAMALSKDSSVRGSVLPANLTKSRTGTIVESILSSPRPVRKFASLALKRSGLGALLTIPQDGFALRFYPTSISASLWYAPHARDADTDFLRRVLQPGDLYVDIGANIGQLALAAAGAVGPTGTVIAVEPHPRTFGFLQGNLALNPQRASVIMPVNAAVGERDGETTFSSFGPDDQNRIVGAGDLRIPLRIPLRTLDHLLAEFPKIAVLKIDVEGYEYFVLQGAMKVLPGVSVVCIEYYQRFFDSFGYAGARVLDLLTSVGFRILIDRDGALHEVDRSAPPADMVNLFAVRNLDEFLQRTGYPLA